MKIKESQTLLKEFLDRWTYSNLQNLTLENYVGLGNKDTFCQWVETKTRMLGSIKGMPSIKFGIYERLDLIRQPKNYKNDDKYSWLKVYGDDRNSAFDNIKRDIITIVELSTSGKFHLIDDIHLPDLFKWKVAFLYSNERLIPIFKHEVLLKIANQFGLKADKKTNISEIQNIMIQNKPAYLSVFEFMEELYFQFGEYKHKNEIEDIANRDIQHRTNRTSTSERDTTSQERTVACSYTVEQKHNKIQKALKENLINEYGWENVKLEENYVDVKLIQPDYISFYEVKSASYATACIKEALGQILLYSFNDLDSKKKKHIVVGQFPPTEEDYKYINFLKSILKVEFEYQFVAI